MTYVPLHDQAALLDRLLHDYEGEREFVFLIGSGVTCPANGMAGVLNVKGIIELVRKELETDRDLQKLDEAILLKPTEEYQLSFTHLAGRRSPGCASRIIRRAVLAARCPEDPFQDHAKRLSEGEYIIKNECESLCEVLENDINNWHVRSGLKSLGTILTDYREAFASSVITTNFDPLLEISIQKANGKADPWPLSGDAPFEWPRSAPDRCRVLHIHGYWSSVDALHTKLVMQQERPYLESALAGILKERVLVVVGYGGWDDIVVRAILRSNRDAGAATNVLWTFYQSSGEVIGKNEDDLIQRLLQGAGGTRVSFYKGIDADQFFPALLKRLQESRNKSVGAVLGAQQTGDDPLRPSASIVKAKVNGRLLAADVSSGTDEKAPGLKPLVHNLTAHFVSLLREREPDMVFVAPDANISLSDQGIQEPNFLLFEREGSVVMTVAPCQASINQYSLQKTTEPQVKAKLLSRERVETIGFVGGKVHPMFDDSGQKGVRIFWDSSLLVQAILFPESKLALPIYQNEDEQKVIAPIGTILELLMKLHGPDKLIFNSVSGGGMRSEGNPVLETLLANSHYITRFAPTPSNQLHLGNARTALASYLLGLRDKQRSRFFLRIDNTDHERTKPHLVKEIEKEVRWLGLQWDETFQQSEAFQTYKRLLNILKLAKLTEEEGGSVFLKSLPLENYYCVYYDRRDGAVISHQPPVTRQRTEKRIKLFRPKGNNAYYQFAGLADDTRCLFGKGHLTYVVRDNRQLDLTRVQAHIRYALELARQKLANNSQAQYLFRESGLDPGKSIPIPLYLHLPFVTDDGEVKDDQLKAVLSKSGKSEDAAFTEALKAYHQDHRFTTLSKREEDETEENETEVNPDEDPVGYFLQQLETPESKKLKRKVLKRYSLEHLRHQEHRLPESIVAYLIATIIPPQPGVQNWRKHLSKIAMVFSHLGVQSSLQFFSTRFTADDLVRNQTPIRCKLGEIKFAEQIIVGKFALWKLQQEFQSRNSAETLLSLDNDLLKRIASHSSDFASFSQMLMVTQRPEAIAEFSAPTLSVLSQAKSQSGSDDEFLTNLRNNIKQVRNEILGLPRSARKTRFNDLRQILRDLRHTLVGQESSPKIEILFDVLGQAEASARIKRPLERTK